MVKSFQLSMEECLLLAPLICIVFGTILGWLCTRLSGIYLAMLTLALSQLLWAICFQWDGFTGGSNGLTGIWPSEFWSSKENFYELTLVLLTLSLLTLKVVNNSPYGLTLKSTRYSAKRAISLGVNVKRAQQIAFSISSAFAGLAGSLFAFSKGNISPDVLGLQRSVDALVIVLMGGINSSLGPLIGAIAYTGLQDFTARETEYWRACLGGLILALLFLLPNGLASIPSAIRTRRTKSMRFMGGS
jgi:branched-chain amino acid transport system permease protein